jgi:hypothetical protein
MSSSTETPTPNVTINAPRDVETFIIDHSFNLVHRGAGTFSHYVPPGIYKLKFRRGLAIVETLEEIGETPRTIEAPPLQYDSAVPLRATRGAEERHLAAARTMSSRPTVTIGNGAELFVFARSEDASDPVAGLTLHDLDGALLVDLQQQAMLADSGCAGCTIALDPGGYRLRSTIVDEPLEQVVVASAFWQTQVFLMREPELPAIASASILMSRNGFDPESEMLRLAEGARIALKEQRTVMPRELLGALLDDNFENPMLGIYAAHALSSEPNDPVFERTLGALERLVPGHPDVAALRVGTGASGIEIDIPPMLRASWTRILAGSNDGRVTMKAGSLSSRIPAALLEGTPWLIWSPASLLDDQACVLRDISGDLSELEAWIDNADDVTAPVELNAPEEELFAYLARRARIQKKTTKNTPLKLDDKTLANAFGTTVANVQAAVSGLATKLRGR